MLDWIKNISKEYPEFWKNYLSKFNVKPNRFVVLSLQTNGLDTENNSILSIGAIAILENNIIIKDVFEIAITDNYPSEYERFIDYIGNSILIGYRINFEIEMINQVLEKMQCGKLKNEALDIEIMHQKLIFSEKKHTIVDILQFYEVLKPDKNAAIEEAFSIAILFLKLKLRLKL